MPAPREGLPSGVVTLVFTDIEGSTRLLTELGTAYRDVLDTHRRLLRALGLDAMTALALAASTPG